MKKYVLFVLIYLTNLVGFTPIKAQEKTTEQIENSIKKNGKYAFLVQNSRHFISAVETGLRFRVKSKKIEFKVILVGQVVKDLATGTELKPFVEKAKKANIQIVVCENSMAHLEVKKSELPPSVMTTRYGFTYFLGLQENGFKTIQL